MGKLKNSEAKTFTLTDWEFNYVKLMATCLTYNVGKDNLISGFLSYVSHERLGVAEGTDLQFELDLDLTEQPYEITVKPIARQEAQQ